MQFVLFWLSCLLLFVSAKEYTERTVSKNVINVPCENIMYQIIYVKATNKVVKDDVVHYLWAAFERPMIAIAHTYVATTLNINNSNICNRTGESFTFSPETNVGGIIIHKVFPYDDVKDKVSLNDSVSFQDIAINFIWSNDTSTESNSASFIGKSEQINGSIIFQTVARDKTTHSDPWPHNPINANLTEFTLILSELPTNTSSTRYAVEVVFFSTTAGNEYDTKKYIDDEFTPGVFRSWAITFTTSQIFATWKPVCYGVADESDRSRDNQAFTYNFDGTMPLKNSGSLPNYLKPPVWTLASGLRNVNFVGMNLTFGLEKDGFYNKVPNISWVGMLGSGKPPVDEITTTTLTIIIVGVGAPALVIFLAIFYILVRKIRTSRDSELYDQIN